MGHRSGRFGRRPWALVTYGLKLTVRCSPIFECYPTAMVDGSWVVCARMQTTQVMVCRHNSMDMPLGSTETAE